MTRQEFLEQMKCNIDQMNIDEFIDAVHESQIFKEPEVPSIFPLQPVHISEDLVVRFIPNRIVEDLLDASCVHGFDMNHIALLAAKGRYTKDEQMQFAQLIGYSVDGYGSLSYATAISCQQAKSKVSEYIKKGLKIE